MRTPKVFVATLTLLIGLPTGVSWGLNNEEPRIYWSEGESYVSQFVNLKEDRDISGVFSGFDLTSLSLHWNKQEKNSFSITYGVRGVIGDYDYASGYSQTALDLDLDGKEDAIIFAPDDLSGSRHSSKLYHLPIQWGTKTCDIQTVSSARTITHFLPSSGCVELGDKLGVSVSVSFLSGSGIFDTSGWVYYDLKSEPNFGPDDGEFSAWTKSLADSSQIKFYAKFPPIGKKIQFMAAGADGRYEEIAWWRLKESDLDGLGNYKWLQNRVYMIRTFDLEPGKNRVRILVDGEIVWGTKTYVLK